jgi:ribosomal protein S18 acetylase RimI-like enzyme
MPVDAAKIIPTPTPLEPGAPEPVTLRSATPADAAALALVKNHTAAAYLNYFAAPDTRITLATSGADAPVGYAMLTAPELPTFAVEPTDIELKRIYLFSRFRAAPVTGFPGVRPAQALLNAAIADARSLGRTRLLLGTHANNLRAIAFYRRNGFAEAGTRTFQVGSQVCSDLIFTKPL